MKKVILLIWLIIPFMTKAQNNQYASYPEYTGGDLGLHYAPEKSSFRIWAPTATKAQLLLYNDGIAGTVTQTIDMQKSESGTWVASVKKELKGKFYVFQGPGR